MLACALGHTEIVELLLDVHNIDVYWKNEVILSMQQRPRMYLFVAPFAVLLQRILERMDSPRVCL